ncbi:MAG: cysteine--tRNA ligase [Vampirovibrionales bacterium]
MNATTVSSNAPLPELQFYNTLSRRVAPFTPLHPASVKMYVCGPTVYDDAHLGHARCNITWDVLYRLLQWWGFETLYARNVTDVDDKIVNRAIERNTTPEAVATFNYARFSEDMHALHTLTPTFEPKATEHIEDMWEMIHVLLEKQHAYVLADGSVYFRTQSMPDYGKLSQKPTDALQAGARVNVDEDKEHPADFALWKATPADTYGWQSPWGWGRPGWHIECSAMIRRILGEQIDIHCGGADLVFPHHENEIAQSECCTNKTPFVNTWMHNGFVTVDGEKMGKSLGNFSTIRDLLPTYDANTLRYFMLTNHYRMPVDFTPDALDAAKTRIQKLWKQLAETLFNAKVTLEQWQTWLEHATPDTRCTPEAMLTTPEGVAFVQAMAKDMNTPKALASWNSVFKQTKTATTAESLTPLVGVLLQQAWVLGFDATPVTVHLQQAWERQAQSATASADRLIEGIYGTPTATATHWTTEALEAVVQARWQAKQAKQFADADALRQQLQEAGLRVVDLPQGRCTLHWD